MATHRLSPSSTLISPPARQRRRRLTTLLATAVVLVPLLAAPADAATLREVSPVDPATGFPFWYADDQGRLDLCLDGAPYCLAAPEDMTVTDGEAFYFSADADISTSAGPGLLGLATEAAFAPGTTDPIVFNRLRIRMDVAKPGRYRVTYPYGTREALVTAVGAGKEINITQDVGCGAAPCDFTAALDSGSGGVGPQYLRWDPAAGPAAPAGYIGDPLTPHAVVGSPTNTNFVEVHRIAEADGTALAVPEQLVRQDQFFVQGRVSRPKVTAAPIPGSYREAQSVTLVGSEPGAEIWYTPGTVSPVDPDGTPSDAAIRYDGAPIAVAQDTTLRAVNVNPASGLVVIDPVSGAPQEPSVLSYVVDLQAPTVAAGPAGGTYASAVRVELTAADAKDAAPVIYYTKGVVAADGTEPADPTTASARYTQPIPVDGNASGRPTVVKAIAVDAAGNVSSMMRESYTVNAPTVTAAPGGGSYGTAQDVTLSASDPLAKIYYSIDGRDPEVVQDAATGAVTGITHGSLYEGPVRLTTYTTLKFMAVTAAGRSNVLSESYLIDIPANRTGGNLAARGPIDHSNGYPFWYGDKGDPARGLDPLRLELCLDLATCPMAAPPPDTSQPVAFPDNYADEGFWWAGEAAIDRPNGGRALLVLAQEAAFGATGEVMPGEQIAFARQRIRLDGLVPGEKYTVTSPYGVDVLTADTQGSIFDTQDIGCLAAPCNFDEALDGRIGPFLRWDPNHGPAAPAGYVGDGATPHRVVGSPHGTNFFRVEGKDIGGTGVHRIETDDFVVMGKIAQLRATAGPVGDLYGSAQRVKIEASFPREAKLVYTTATGAGATAPDPAVDANGQVTSGTEYIPTEADQAPGALVDIPVGETQLKFIAVDLKTHQATRIYTENYRVDETLPAVTATPDGADGPFAGHQTVTLTAADPQAQPTDGPLSVYYTLDGTKPRLGADGQPFGSTRQYSAPLRITRTTTLKAFAVNSRGIAGAVSTGRFVIRNLSDHGPISAVHGFPEWIADNGLPGGAPTSLDLCLGDVNCPVMGDLPFPDQPISFPNNFPDEAFWWTGDAVLDLPGGGRAKLVLALEAAFANGSVVQGDQIAFGRTRVNMQGLVPNASYRITHPYGVMNLTADGAGAIGHVNDIGCMTGPCDWPAVFESEIGPFLRWNSGAPAGYLGDGATPHAVVGSPFNTNFFRIEQVTNGSGAPIAATPVAETSNFIVQGRITGTPPTLPPPTVSAAPPGGTYTAAQQVTLTASEAGAEIRYTTNGDTPTAASTLYTGPVTIGEGGTALKFLAIAGNRQSAVMTENYSITIGAPTVTLAPPNPAIIVIGGSSGLQGTLAAADGAPIAGAVVSLEGQRIGTTGFAAGPTTVTDAQGAFAFTGLKPTAGTDYRVRFAADGTHKAAVSELQRVSVRAVVAIDPIPTTSRGRDVTITGRMGPTHAGSGITVRIVDARGRSRPVTGTVDVNGFWRVVAKAPGDEGTYPVTASWAGDADHLGASSPTVRITVVR